MDEKLTEQDGALEDLQDMMTEQYEILLEEKERTSKN